MRVQTYYFDELSQANTQKVLSVVNEFLMDNLSVEHIVVASTGGATGLEAAQRFKNKTVIVVSHQAGFAAPNENELKDDQRERIINEGARILTATHAFAGVARGIRVELGGWQPTEIIAVAFRTFGQGTKVCAEIAMMAADAGLIPTDRDVVCIAGTGKGADTAWIVQPANTHAFPKLRMKACLCKPLKF